MKNWVYHLLALATIAVWGVTFINTKLLLQAGMRPEEIFLVRFIVAYLSILIASPRKLFAHSWRDELVFFALGFSGGSLYFLSENTAIGISFVNNVAFIVCTAPLLTALLAIVFVGDIPASRSLLLGSALALLGVAIVVFNGKFVLQLNPLGDFLAFIAAFCWAVYSIIIKRVSRRYSAVFITRKVFFYGILTILPLFLFRPWHFPLAAFQQPVVWGNLLFLGLVASCLCFFAWSLAVSKIGVMATTNYVYLNPVTTVVASALILGESMMPMAILGSAFILLGLFIANRHASV